MEGGPFRCLSRDTSEENRKYIKEKSVEDKDSMLTMEKADPSKKKVLWNLLQKYLYEFSVYYRDQVDEDGNQVISFRSDN